jgi:hypothetical protein
MTGSDVAAASIAPAYNALAAMTPWKMFQRCVWLSDEKTNTKATLLCVSRFMDSELRGSSMSYTQIARDCGFSESTAKRCIDEVENSWLRIERGGGRYIPGKGRENLYHGIIPQKWFDTLRYRGRDDAANVPEPSDGLSPDEAKPGQSGEPYRHPERQRARCQAATGVSDNSVRGVRATQVHQISPEDRIAAPTGAADTTNAPKRKRRSSRSQIAVEWQPSDADKVWVQDHYLATEEQIAEQAAQFRDHHRARGSLMADWSAAWRTWWQSPYQKVPRRQPASGSSSLADDKSLQPHWWRDYPQAPKAFNAADWQDLIDKYGAHPWSVEMLGPPPGEPGCIIPESVLRELNFDSSHKGEACA